MSVWERQQSSGRRNFGNNNNNRGGTGRGYYGARGRYRQSSDGNNNREGQIAQSNPDTGIQPNAPSSAPPALREVRATVGTISQKKFNWLMLDHSSPLVNEDLFQSTQEARDFIAFILASPDKLEMLSRLTSSEYGLTALRNALSLQNNLEFVKQSVIPLIRFIGDDGSLACFSPSRVTSAIKLLRTIYKAPLLFAELAEMVINNRLEQEECVVIGWLVLQVIKGGDDFSLEAKEDHLVRKLASALSESTKYPMAKAISDQINTLLETSGARGDNQQLETIPELRSLRSKYPGWRHDNDKPDFHAISLYPTAGELNCKEEPFLPETCDVLDKEPRKVASYLDWAFRLLRDDVNGIVKDELAALKEMSRPKSRLLSYTVDVIKISEISFNPRLGVLFKMVFKEPKSLADSLKPNMSTKDLLKVKMDYWEQRPNFLRRESMLAFIRRKHPDDSELIGLGVIMCRKTKQFNETNQVPELLQSPPSIDVYLFDKADVHRVVRDLGVEQKNLQAVQLSASFFAFIPILERLKMLSSIPFEEEILHDGQVQPPSYFEEKMKPVFQQLENAEPAADVSSILGTKNKLVLDPNQKLAVTSSMTHRVALIHGPPGTGKSYCSAIIAKLIIDNSNETILCVAYTTHVLDRFLIELIDFGLPTNQIVRIGSPSKVDERILPFTLKTLLKNHGLSYNRQRMSRDLQERMKRLEVRINELKDWIPKLKKTMEFKHFEEPFFAANPDLSNAFCVPSDKVTEKAIEPDYLWKRWIDGQNRGILKAAKNWRDETGSVWLMNREVRKEKVEEWRQEMIDSYMEELDKTIARYNEHVAELNEMNQIADIELLKKRRIIACTTTGAAKYATKLGAVSAGVMIMEEAGEILEAHVITSMAANCKHLIMIGDHKQLRPKVHNYKLSVESNGPFKFNRSLFERLITKTGFPHVTLNLQHRMRPEISDVVRKLAYPELKDADSVKDKPNVSGLQSNVVFINHDEPEGNDEVTFPNGKCGDDTLSKVNLHEVGIASKLAKYLLYQGYRGKDIVILTPYLAQLNALRQEMSNVFTVMLSEMDRNEFARFGVGPDLQADLPSPTLEHDTPRIRASTIDNYQGEEANIIIGSLVRSNYQGAIGFLRHLQRVNVLLSRARAGLILIGNIRTFQECKSADGKELWDSLLNMLYKRGAIYNGLPAYCADHDRKFFLPANSGFNLRNEGGCDLECRKMFACGKHFCGKKCHRKPTDHGTMPCPEMVVDFCSKGHEVPFPCKWNADRYIDKHCESCIKN